MKNGLFKRYFLIFSLTLIVSTLMLGIALLYFSALNFTSEKEGMLYNAAQKYIDLSSTATTNTDADGYVYNKPKLERLLTAISDSSGATLTVCNAAGKVVACSELDTCHHTGLSQETLNKTVKRGEYSSAGYFEGFFRNRGDYTFGMPIFSNGVAVGFIFASASIMPLFSFLADLLITFLISSGVMLIGAIVIVYFSTRALTAPLHQMSAAAKSFGSGDFSARVTVEGDDEIAGLA
ncbi:MAG: HAMP domain-containing protein, partial [Oscillospiraceae bacterium]